MGHGGGMQGHTLARAATLAAELLACVGELSTPGAESAPPAIERLDKLSTKAAAERLGVSSYTLREWVRRGWIHARQDAPRGPLHFDAAELARYEREHQTRGLPTTLAESYSPGHGNPGASTHNPPRAKAHASGARESARRDSKHGRTMGTGRARRRPLGGASPNAPNAHAWAGRPPWPETGEEPEPKG